MTTIKNLVKTLLAAVPVLMIASCQKMERPTLGTFPADHSVTPTTSLRFYVPFDSSAANASQINIRFADSISGYPSFFPDKSIKVVSGIRGTGYSSSSGNFLTYYNANDFIATAKSFTVAFWEKRNGRPDGDAQFPFAFPSGNGHWAGTAMMLLFDHQGAGATNDSAVIKFVLVDKNVNDNWFVWDGAHRIKAIQDNQWHHLAFVYDAPTSTMSLYVDGVKNAYTQTWGGHGDANMDASKVSGLKIGGRPIENLGWGKSWNGSLDQFRLYNTALTAADVLNLFNNKL